MVAYQYKKHLDNVSSASSSTITTRTPTTTNEFINTKEHFKQCVKDDTILGLHLSGFSTQHFAFQSMLDSIRSSINTLHDRKK
eukprot:UN09499